MMKLMLAAAASLTLAGTAGAQMTGGNTMTAQPGSTAARTKAVVHKRRVVAHKVTHHKTTTASPGTMGNTM